MADASVVDGMSYGCDDRGGVKSTCGDNYFCWAFGSNETRPKLAIVVSDVITCNIHGHVCMLHCVRLFALCLARSDRNRSLRNGRHVLRRNGKNLRFRSFFAVGVQAL
jgi:hypothetical protein